MVKFLIKTLILLCSFSIAQAQQKGVKAIIDKIALHNTVVPVEKLYVTIDKPYYALGDTLWFKAYLLDADNQLGAVSNKVHIEILNDSSIVILKKAIAISEGVGWGEFPISADFTQENYTIRAYTSLQQNFGTDYFYFRKFAVSTLKSESWLISSAQKIISTNNGKNIALNIRLSNLQKQAIALKDLELTLMDDKKGIQKINLQSDINGIINTDLIVPNDKISGEMSIIIRSKLDKEKKLILPLKLISDKIDLQFMPEGGNLLEDQFGRVAFKAIGSNGIGINVKGKILNNRNEEVATFASTHRGMGSFFFYPKAGETYKAIVDSNSTSSFQFPATQKSGTSMRIANGTSSDSIYIYLRATADKRIEENYSLLAQTGGKITYASNVNLKNGFFNLKLPKSSFPVGITHFTLFSPSQIPLNERIVLVKKPELIKIAIEADKSSYAITDSIALDLNFSGDDGKRLALGSYSISVTDDSQVTLPAGENILLNYLLQSELKGNIEDSSWYFMNADQQTTEALDNLLLTQGWIGYNWKNIFENQTPKFISESINSITGGLTNLFKKPVSNIKLTLLSFGKEPIFAETLSDVNGKFAFTDLPIVDTVSYSIKIKNAKEKASGATIKVDEFIATTLKLVPSKELTYWYNNPDSALLNYFKTNEKRQKEALTRSLSGTALKEVVINGVRKIPAGPGMAWSAFLESEITETELKKNPQESLLNLLNQKIKGFKETNYWQERKDIFKPYRVKPHKLTNFTLFDKRIANVIVDGISIKGAIGLSDLTSDDETALTLDGEANDESTNPDMYGYLGSLFSYIAAEDVKNIQAYVNAYFSYLIITTRSGSGPWIKKGAGLYVFRPQPLSFPKVFYSPKYAATPQNIDDLRATIYWAPNISANEKGNAKVSFYAASRPATYTITIEGTDLKGNFGFQTKKINIKAIGINN